MIDITASDGFVFSAYRADPAGAPKGAVVVLQELFGVTRHIRDVVDAHAARGYVAVAPCLFDRAKKGVELGADEAGAAEGLALVRGVGFGKAMADIQATVESVAAHGKVVLIGYDWGGYLAYHAANLVKGLACAIGYYGCGIAEDPGPKRRIPTQLHFGLADPHIPAARIIGFRSTRPDVRVYEYPAGHGFAAEGRAGYSAEAAGLALERVATLIAHTVEGPPTVTLKNAGAYAASANAKADKKKKKPAGEDDLGPPL
ncbi:carboxymethylenebutenolidase [Methylomagnum ishizawai]|uniref:Carboxymethylenebutenolidase n=1 Tax=Methylomagnum ishizawai TaxID=1760988 RepID=A0A1Y6D3F8_9GAMM|nr:dienelactone hydrolase family protein [Methylomagnum ishizawai]SMF97187.1 carboxymethylenebutenolidase [Methylomagnum ishizawai]